MKREDILFYMSEGKINIYLVNEKKEQIIETDTSLFFKYGEISNEFLCENKITEILTKLKFGGSYLKPNVKVLYNDICYADAKFLYRSVFRGFSYNCIEFAKLSKVVRLINESKNLVVFDKNYYILVDRGEKCIVEERIDFEPIFIGKNDSLHIHYSDNDIIWNTFKSHFTNIDIYDKIDSGDDE